MGVMAPQDPRIGGAGASQASQKPVGSIIVSIAFNNICSFTMVDFSLIRHVVTLSQQELSVTSFHKWRPDFPPGTMGRCQLGSSRIILRHRVPIRQKVPGCQDILHLTLFPLNCFHATESSFLSGFQATCI